MQAVSFTSAQLTLLVVAWVTLALVNAGLAQGKRRRGWAWFLPSLVLGPLVTLLVVLVPSARPRLF